MCEWACARKGFVLRASAAGFSQRFLIRSGNICVWATRLDCRKMLEMRREMEHDVGVCQCRRD